MSMNADNAEALRAENAELRARLEEAEKTLRALRSGEPRPVFPQGLDKGKSGLCGEMLAQVSDAVIAVDLDERVTFLNPAAERQYGIAAAEALGRKLTELYTYRWLRPDDETAAWTALAQRGEWRGENLHLTRDGRELRVESSVTMLRDAAGSPTGLLAAIRDVTAQRNSEARADFAQRQTESIINNNPALVYAFDLEGRFLLANTAVAATLATTPGQLLGKRRHEFMPKEDADRHEANDRKVSVEGTAIEFEEQSQLQGRTIFWLTSKFPLRDAHGKIYGIAGTSTDVTARKQAQEEKMQTLRLLDTLLTHAPVGFAYFDLDLRFVRINERLAEINGFPAAAHLGRHIGEIVPKLAPFVREVTDRILATGEAVSDHEFTGETPREPGILRSWNESWYPVRCERGEIIGFGVVVEEITRRKQAEESLGRMAAIVESSHDALFSENLDGIITTWNRGAEQIFGYRADEIVGTPVTRLIPETGQAAEQERQQKIIAGERVETFEAVRRTKDGREFHASITLSPLQDAAGKIIGSSRVVRDVTERLRIEDQLRRSEALYRRIGESIDYGVWVCAPDGRNTYASESFLKMVGLTQEQCSNFGWGEVLHPDDAERTIHAWQECVRTCGNWDIQHRFRGVDGAWHHVLARGVPVKDSDGEVLCWAGINLDITLLKKTQEELHTNEQRMRLATEATGVGIWEWNVHTNRIRWDATMFAIYGVAPTADSFVSYETWRSAVLPEDLPRQEEVLMDTARRGGQSKRVFRIRRAGDAACRWIEACETVRTNEAGEPEWVIGTNLDVTAHIEAEQAVREEAQRKDRFLAMLGHELRNPLNAIRHAVQIRQETPDDPEAGTWAAHVIDRQSQQISRMVEDLLDVARINRGAIKLQPETLDVAVVLERAVAVVRPLIQQHRHTLETKFCGPLSVTGDAVRLEQVFVNLLHNSAKYTPEGGRISLRAQSEDGEAMITISDNGVGISAELLPHVFDLFRQADDSLDRSLGGLGIGLSVVKSLVEMHCGRVTVASVGPQKGTTVTVRLPLLLELKSPGASHPSPSPTTAMPKCRRVLIIDDHEDAAQALAHLLQRRGCELRCAHTGPDGVAAAREFQPDILLLDLGLPGFDGYEVARLLRADKRFPHLLIVAISGYAQQADRQRCLSAGFDDHFAKPVDFPKLLSIIQSGCVESAVPATESGS